MVGDATYRKDTFFHRYYIDTAVCRCFEDTVVHTFFNYIGGFFNVKTSFGQVLEEIESSQESPGRNLLPRKTYREAEKAAKKILEIQKYNKFVDQIQKGKAARIHSIGNDRFLHISWEINGENGVRLNNEYILHVLHFNTTVDSPIHIYSVHLPYVERYNDGKTVVSWFDGDRAEKKEKVFECR